MTTLRRTGPLTFLVLLAACESRLPGPIVRRARVPVERTLAELRPRYQEPIVACDLPSADSSPDGIQLVAPEGTLRIPVQQGWDAVPAVDTVIELSDTTVTARWRDEGRGRLTVQRMRFADRGPTWTERASVPLQQLPTCEISEGDAGAIWRRYDPQLPDTSTRRFPYTAHGEVITADSLRYKVDVSAATANDRDLLLRRISDGAMGRVDSRATR